MDTKIITYKEKNLALEALRQGEVIAFPTETVFGLGAIASKKEAFDRLVQIKKRTPGKPFTLMCSSIGMAIRYCEIDAHIINAMKEFFPGQITLLLKARKGLPEWVTLGGEKVGIRVPDDKNLLDLIEELGEPILAPSANISNQPPLTDPKSVFDTFKGDLPYIFDGKCVSNIPSTIVDLCSNKIELVRQGAIYIDEISNAYNKPVLQIGLGADHGGFKAKEAIKAHLLERGFGVKDFGTHSLDSVDYPDFAFAVARSVGKTTDFGIVVCTSGEGISIACNRFAHVRCGIGYDDVATAKLREHNNANIIAFGQKYMSIEDILRRVDIFLGENFSKEEKHRRRVDKLNCRFE